MRITLALAALIAAMLPSVAEGASARTCDVRSVHDKLGPSYVTSLKVTGVGCATGKDLVRAYYRCRKREGGLDGRCRTKVLRYTCTETRKGIAIQFDAKVTCKRGARRVVHTYTQNT